MKTTYLVLEVIRVNNLREVKWVTGRKYYLDGRELDTKDRWNEKEYQYENDLTNLKKEERERVEIIDSYDYGYFHKWITFHRYMANESATTEELALIELKDGTLKYMSPMDIIFVNKPNYEGSI